MARAEGSMNLRDQALDGIRNLIFSRELEIGVKTSEREIAEKLHMSRTPVREALAILSESRMVDQYPKVGVAVRDVTLDEALRILRIRSGVEGVVVEQLASIKSPRVIEDLRLMVHEMKATKDIHVFMDADTSFHCQMAGLAGFATGIGTIRSLRDRLHLFRLTRLSPTPQEMDAIVKEHQAIVDAIAGSSDGDECVKTLKEHFTSSQARLSKYISESVEALQALAAEAGIQNEIQQLFAAAKRHGLSVHPRSRDVVAVESPPGYVLCELHLLPGKIHLDLIDGFVHHFPVTDEEVTKHLGSLHDLRGPDLSRFVDGLDELFAQIEVRKGSAASAAR
jgi:DNA-binding GntR family transcriptional regulator